VPKTSGSAPGYVQTARCDPDDRSLPEFWRCLGDCTPFDGADRPPCDLQCGSLAAVTPAPACAGSYPSSASPAPLFNPRTPAWIVLRDRPVACATSDTPPCGNACASVAAQSRRCRSSSTLRSAWYFLRIPPTSSFCPMRKAYHTYLICTSYLCAEPKSSLADF